MLAPGLVDLEAEGAAAAGLAGRGWGDVLRATAGAAGLLTAGYHSDELQLELEADSAARDVDACDRGPGTANRDRAGHKPACSQGGAGSLACVVVAV